MNVNVKRQSMGINQSAVNRLPGREKVPGREWSKWLLIKGFIVGLLPIMLCILSHAQEVMKIGSYTDVQRRGNKYIDMVLPKTETLPFGWIYLEARGGDGGRRSFNNGILIPDGHLANGGEGATLGGWAEIKDNAEGCIPSGSKIRFIIGERGKSWKSNSWDGSGGGGGTGILFLPPNAGNDDWQHLIIASAGGGAYARKRFNILSYGGNSGGGGHAYADSTSGKASKSTYLNGQIVVQAEYYGLAAGWKYSSAAGAEPGWRPNYGDWADWVKVYGKLKGISITDEGTVWGVGLNNEIYRRKAADSAWEKVPGTFRQVSVAGDGIVWGVNSDNKIYRLKDNNGTWETLPGIPLKQISVAADGTAWGVNSNNEIYHRKDDDSNWERIPGSLVQISHGSDSDVWGINSKDEIFRRKVNNKGWDKIPGLFRQISVATDGRVWGVNGKGEIFRRRDDFRHKTHSGWIKMISYSNVVFKAVSAGSSTNIWALDKNGDIYYCNGPSDSSPGPFGGKGASGFNRFTRPFPEMIFFPMKYTRNGGWGYGGGGAGRDYCGGNGGGSCGGQYIKKGVGGGGYSWINEEYISKELQMIRKDGRSDGSPRKHPKNGYAKYEISNYDTPITPWVKVDGKLNNISVADDGTVWGVDKNNEIYRRTADDSAWEKVAGVPYQVMSIVQLSHSSDSGVVWGVNKKNEIYHRRDGNSNWEKVPGLLKQVSVAADGTVWGLNPSDMIYRRKDDDSSWERISGLLKQISVAADGTVWGVNRKNVIYRREYDNRSWMKIPGELKQVSVASDGTIGGVPVWGVGTDNKIYYRNEDGSGWKNMSAHNHVNYTQVSAGTNTNIWALDINDNIYYYNSSNSLKSAEVATSNPDLINGITRENGMYNPIDMDPVKTGEFCVKVYPNPASSFLTIEVTDAPAGDILCSLFNAFGHVVARQSISSGVIQLNVSGFPKGLYTVVITVDGVKTVEKLMID